jgi:hypothetical protein
MKKIRAVVELSVPDSHRYTEADFAKSLRRQFRSTGISLAPTFKESRPIQFKEFSRVVQYTPDGQRIAPTRPPSPFESLVLFGLWVIVRAMITPRDLSKSLRLQKWFNDVRATVNAAEEREEDEGVWANPDKRAADQEQMQLHDETVATAKAEGHIG